MKPLKFNIREYQANNARIHTNYCTGVSLSKRIERLIASSILEDHIQRMGNDIHSEIYERLIYVTRK